jgi:thiazole synthase
MSPLVIAGREFRSRLFLGTGKFPSNESMRDALAASGAEIVTVALRRADLSGGKDPYANILDFIDPEKYLLLPNTSGAMNAAEAVRLARLAAAAGLPKWVKLEIHPDPTYLLPDPIETLKAAEILVGEGFTVLPYINADPVLAKRLQEVGTATVMRQLCSAQNLLRTRFRTQQTTSVRIQCRASSIPLGISCNGFWMVE